jgi:O-antigen/teichoic acid export membrane protein
MVPSDDALPDSPPSAKSEPRGHKIDAHEVAVAIRNSLKIGASLLITNSVGLIVKFQIPAHLGPIRQGHFAFAESFATMFFAAIGLGVDRYIIKEVPVRPQHASDFVGGTFALQGALSFVLFGAMATTLWATHRSVEIQYAVLVFGATQFLMCINQTLATILQAASQVGRLAVANVVAKFVWGAGLLIGLHYNVPLFALALPMLACELLRTAFLVPAATISAKLRYHIHARETWAVLVASLPFFISAIAAGFGGNVAMTALEYTSKDEREIGWFSACQNLGALVMVLFPIVSWIVMPMLSRARARSYDEMMSILRRSIEALVIIVLPGTVLISAGADVFIHLAYRKEFAPAATGLSILSVVYLMFYVSIVLSNGLVIMGKSWSVTLISLSTIALMAVFTLVFVPIGRALFGVGGECAGAAMAVIANEVFMVVAMLSRYREMPFDRRSVGVVLKSAAISAFVLVVNHFVLRLGAARLVLELALYLGLAFAFGVVRLADMKRVLSLVRARRAESRPA